MAVGAAPAAAGETPRDALAQLAAQHTHGWSDVSRSYLSLEDRLAAGGRVYVPCGVISILGLRLMERLDIPARLVGAFSDERGEMFDVPAKTLESHAMLEVWEQDRWVLYDLDSNARAVDEAGQGVGLVEFATGERFYDRLASDLDHELAESPYPIYESWLFANHEFWYDRVLGTPAILSPGTRTYAFTGSALRDTLEAIPGYDWVTPERFGQIAAAPPAPPPVQAAPPAPLTPPQTPAPAAAPSTVAKTAAPAVTRPCRIGGRRVRHRELTCKQARRVLRRYLRTDAAPRKWRCRTGRTVRCFSSRTAAFAIRP